MLNIFTLYKSYKFIYFIRFYKQDISNYYNPLNTWRNIQVLPGFIYIKTLLIYSYI